MKLLDKLGRRYTSCGELPLYNFIKIITTQKLDWLKISGYSSKKTLMILWEDIFTEYLALSKDTKQNYLLSVLKDISFLTFKLNIIQIIVDELSKGHDPALVECLHTLGFRFKYDPEDAEQYVRDLQLTVSQSKTMLIKIKESEAALLKIKQDSSSNVDESEYDMYLSELSKFQGYRLDPKTITVSEFVAIVNRFKEEIERNKRQKQ